jgi:hypothetical protein
MLKEEIIAAFRTEFHFIQDRFEIMDLLENGSMDYETIGALKLPTNDFNIVWHPGVYVFLGNNYVYRVGVSMRNSRGRVMQHLEACTSGNGHCIWDIEKHPDGSILLFNVRDKTDNHWLLSLEVYLENKFKPLIKAKRKG